MTTLQRMKCGIACLLLAASAYAQTALRPFADAEAVRLNATRQLEPTSYLATYNLALAYKQDGNPQAAIELLERTLEKQPSAELHNLLASLEEETGRYVEAVRHYQRAVDLEPDDEQYYFDLGAEYLMHLTLVPATEVFRVGSQRFPASPRLYVGRGLAQFALRQYADAADAFIDALEVDPASPDAFLAWNALPTFVMVAEWERIQPRLQRLAERFPGNAQALSTIRRRLPCASSKSMESERTVDGLTKTGRTVRRLSC